MEAAECEQATIYDAYVNSWNSGDTACSCHGVAEEREQRRFTGEGLDSGGKGATSLHLCCTVKERS